MESGCPPAASPPLQLGLGRRRGLQPLQLQDAEEEEEGDAEEKQPEQNPVVLREEEPRPPQLCRGPLGPGEKVTGDARHPKAAPAGMRVTPTPSLAGPFANPKQNEAGEGAGGLQHTGKLRQGRDEAATNHPCPPSPSLPAPSPHADHFGTTEPPPRAAGRTRGALTSAQAAPAPRPLRSCPCHPPQPPAPRSRCCPGPVAPARSWGGRRQEAVLSPVGRWQTVPRSPHHAVWVPLGAGRALGPLRLAGGGRSAVRAGTWLGTKRGDFEQPPRWHRARWRGRSPLLSPLCCAGPYQELLGDDGDADSAAGRRLRGSEGLR